MPRGAAPAWRCRRFLQPRLDSLSQGRDEVSSIDKGDDDIWGFKHPHSTDSAYLHPFSHEVYHTFPVNSLNVLTLTQQILGVCGLSFYLIQPLTGIDLALHLHRPWLFQRNHRSFWFLTWTLTLWWGSSDNLSFFANFSSTHRNN